MLHPADIFCSAVLPGRLAATDIGIVCPQSTGVGVDGGEAMHQRKMATSRAHLPSLARAGIWYVSMIWFVCSRAHPEAEQEFESVARAAVVHRRFQEHCVVLRMSVQWARRAVRMVRD